MADWITTLFASLSVFSVAVYFYKWFFSPIHLIPTVGNSSFWPGVFRHPEEFLLVLEEGYVTDGIMGRSSKSGFVTDEELSAMAANTETLQMARTFGPGTVEDPYHNNIVREKLTRSLPVLFPSIFEEITLAVPAYIPADEKVGVMGVTQHIIARVSNRVFVGDSACRMQKYLDLTIAFAGHMIQDATILNLFRRVLRCMFSVVAPFASRASSDQREVIKCLQSLIDEHQGILRKYGSSWDKKPRLMAGNFAAIHTTSIALSHILYYLAQYPECLASILGMCRQSMKDMTLSNGMVIPSGTIVCPASYHTHHDSTIYANAEGFDPFRFARMREEDAGGARHLFVNASTEYMPFRYRKHTYPDRYFAASELKAVVGYIALHYDLKLPDDVERPENMYFGLSMFPALDGKLLFKKRELGVSVWFHLIRSWVNRLAGDYRAPNDTV
ncbi:cytochrome P450 [Trametes meyenii]|nr:cytochrome P450 [Trametes meyenii]